MIRILLVHDTVLLRSALSSLLGGEPDLDVVPASWPEAPRCVRGRPADVWLMDADCPGFAAGTCEGRLAPGKDPHGRAVVLVPKGRPRLLLRAHEAHALGYVSTDAPPERLIGALRDVAKGQRYVDQVLAEDLLSVVHKPLTRRELDVLSLAADGLPVAEIAQRLRLAQGTVRNYLASIVRKSGARNRLDAIRIARQAGWL